MYTLVYYQFNTCSALYHHLLSGSHNYVDPLLPLHIIIIVAGRTPTTWWWSTRRGATWNRSSTSLVVSQFHLAGIWYPSLSLSLLFSLFACLLGFENYDENDDDLLLFVSLWVISREVLEGDRDPRRCARVCVCVCVGWGWGGGWAEGREEYT